MQSIEGSSTLESVGQLLVASDPDDFLMQKYSTFLQDDKEELQFCKLYLYHFELRNKIAFMEDQIQELRERVSLAAMMTTPKKPSTNQQKSLRQQQNSQSNQNTNRHKRMRRTANEISRHFHCPVETCRKQYGSQGSLNQHIKLKHQYLLKGLENWAVGQKGQEEIEQ